MIISASRRTDIPRYYSDWFFNRLRERFVLVRNHINPRLICRADLSPEAVDAIVFWTKNPAPMLEKLHLLADYPYYFQFTLNSYSVDVEPGIPPKGEIINTFKKLAEQTGRMGQSGPGRVVWRYDPILLNEKYTIPYHTDNFGVIARHIRGYAEKVTVSFIDFYSKIMKNISGLNIKDINNENNANGANDAKHELIKNLSAIAKENDFIMDTCAEDIDLSAYGVSHAKCIDGKLIERIAGRPLKAAKDKSQRPLCGCVKSVDIGAYNSCMNGCLYCYANHSKQAVENNMRKHNPLSPLLIGELDDNAKARA